MNPLQHGPRLEPDILTRSLKRSREGENFDLILRKLERDHGLPLWAEAQQIGVTGWSPSRRSLQSEAARCLSVMRQVFWRNPSAFGQALELFEQMSSTQQNLQTLLSLMEAQSSSNISPPKRISPSKTSPTKATHGSALAQEVAWKYRSNSEVESVVTSATSSRSTSGGTDGTSFTEVEASPPSPGTWHKPHDSLRLRAGGGAADLPEGFSDDFETDLDLTQPLAENDPVNEEDLWLRRRSSPDIEVADKQEMEHHRLASPPRQLVEPDWFSSWPLQTQLTQDGSGSPSRNNALIETKGTSEREVEAQEDPPSSNEHWHLRELAQQGLFGKVSTKQGGRS